MFDWWVVLATTFWRINKLFGKFGTLIDTIKIMIKLY
jgi:hypothetical protein